MSSQLLVLAASNDPTGPWVRDGLEARTHQSVQLITPEQIFSSDSLRHGVCDSGAWFELILGDGRAVSSDDVLGVVNRISHVPASAGPAIASSDHEYVMQERHALCLSMFEALDCPVFNPATPRGLAGAWRSELEWKALAANAGLHVRPTTQTRPAIARRLITFGAETIDNGVDDRTRQACLELSRLSATPMLQVDLAARQDGSSEFCAASIVPDLMTAGAGALDALAYVLTEAQLREAA